MRPTTPAASSDIARPLSPPSRRLLFAGPRGGSPAGHEVTRQFAQGPEEGLVDGDGEAVDTRPPLAGQPVDAPGGHHGAGEPRLLVRGGEEVVTGAESQVGHEPPRPPVGRARPDQMVCSDPGPDPPSPRAVPPP